MAGGFVSEKGEVTLLINQWIKGDKSNENELIKKLYPALRKIAHQQINKNKSQNLNTTLIVNELYLKLQKQNRIQLQDKNHFLAFCAQLVRQTIIDYIRQNDSLKRGKSLIHITLNEAEVQNYSSEINIDLLTIDRLLHELEQIDPDSVRLIELRFFAGLTMQETAKVCNTSTASISRNWKFAKTWLFNKLKE